jgi:hypothetical protein
VAVAVQADAAVTDIATLVAGIERGFDELTVERLAAMPRP